MEDGSRVNPGAAPRSSGVGECSHVDVQEVARRGVLVADYLARHAIEPAELVQSVPDEDLHAGRCANVRRSCAGKRHARAA